MSFIDIISRSKFYPFIFQYPVLGANNHFEMAEKVNSHAYELPAEFSYSNECRRAVRNVS